MAGSAGQYVESHTDNTWEIAKKIADKLKPLPIAFTSSVRLLISDHFHNDGAIRPVTKFQTARIFRSKSFRAMLYYATLDLHNENVRDSEYVSVGQLMNNYTAGDIAALIGTYVFFKKVRRRVDDAEWNQLRMDLICRLQAGAAAGVAVKRCGVGTGLLTAGMPLLTLCSLYPFNEKGFTEYRRYLQANNYLFDEARELQNWHCTIPQVASIALSLLGFGVDVSEALLTGANPNKKFENLQSELHREYHMARLWIQAFLEAKEQPLESVPGEYFPLAADRDKAEHAMGCLIEGYTHWFERTQDDATPELTPQLFPPSDPGSDIPEDLQDVFSLEEITKMEEEDFDDLIDQIDMEQSGEVAMGNTTMSTSDLDALDDEVS